MARKLRNLGYRERAECCPQSACRKAAKEHPGRLALRPHCRSLRQPLPARQMPVHHANERRCYSLGRCSSGANSCAVNPAERPASASCRMISSGGRDMALSSSA